jgi:hypothetical protein
VCKKHRQSQWERQYQLELHCIQKKQSHKANQKRGQNYNWNQYGDLSFLVWLILHIFNKWRKLFASILPNIHRPSPPGKALKTNPSMEGHIGFSFLNMPITAKIRLGMQASSPIPIPAITPNKEAISSDSDANPIVEATPTSTPAPNANKDNVPITASRRFMAP